jgi:hypothetical protein
LKKQLLKNQSGKRFGKDEQLSSLSEVTDTGHNYDWN